MRDARNAVLLEMTDEVAELVLADNRDQNDVLGIARAHAPAMVSVHARLTADLEARRGLDRELEVLPDDAGYKALEAAGAGLTSPELATLLAHTKLDLTAQVLATDLPDVAAFAARLPEYFPQAVRERFAPAVRRAPAAARDRHDAAGQRDGRRRRDDVRVPAGRGALRRPRRRRAGLRRHHRRVRPARAVGGAAVAADPDGRVGRARAGLATAARPGLAVVPHQPPAAARGRGRGEPVRVHGARAARGAAAVAARARAGSRRDEGRGAAVGRHRVRAARCATPCSSTATGCSTSSSSRSCRSATARRGTPEEVAALYYGLSEHLGIDAALNSVTALERGDRWHALARLALRDDLYASLRSITLDALREAGPGTSVEKAIALWEKANASRLVRARAALYEVGTAGQLDLATLSVVSRQLRGLAVEQPADEVCCAD